jgi:hypothetical protein
MKKFSILLVLALSAIIGKAQVNHDQQPYMTKSLAGQTIKNVEVETSGGSIHVTGGTGSDARVEVYVRPNNMKDGSSISKEEIQKRLEEYYTLTVTVENNKLKANAKQKRNNMDWKKAVSISFRIYVQQNVSTDLTTSGGSINLSNLNGTQEFTTSGGSLTVEKLSGKVKGTTSGGSIHLSDSKDDIDLSTSGGSIEAEDCTGKIKLTTSGGSLKLSDLNGEIVATTSGGSIRGEDIQGSLATHTSGGNIDLEDLNCSVNASTSGGNIDVEVTTLKGFVKLGNSGGNINLTVPNKAMDLKLSGGRIKTDKLSNFSGSIEEEMVNGKVNGGGVPVTVNAGSGRITLSLK